MLRHSIAALVALILMVAAALAADKEVKGKIVRVDVRKKALVVRTDEGNKTYEVNDETKFIGPGGGESDAGLKDERLVRGAEIKLVIAGNNRTVREVHLPERKKDKEK